MFSGGNFRAFPIDDDVSIGSMSEILSSTLSRSITSFDMSEMDWTRDELSRFRFQPQSLDNLDEISTSTSTKSIAEFSSIPNDLDLQQSIDVDSCDVTFLVGPNVAPIHGQRDVMSTRSVILQALFISHENVMKSTAPKKSTKRGILAKLFRWKSKGRKQKTARLVISLPEHDASVFNAFVTYLHTGTADINYETLIGLLRLADLYKVDDLRHACWQFSEGPMTSHTAIKLLTQAERFSHSEAVAELTEKLMSHIDRDCRHILTNKHFLTTPATIATTILTRPQLPVSENDRVSAMLAWARHHHRHTPADLPATLTRLLNCVNLSHVTNPKVRDDVIDMGFVPAMDGNVSHKPPRGSHTVRRKLLVDRRTRVGTSTLYKKRQALETSSSGCDSGSGSS